MFRIYLPSNNTWDSVKTTEPIAYRPVYGAIVCSHTDRVPFTWTDFRSGPGGYSGSYKGTVCVDCSKIMTIIKVF